MNTEEIQVVIGIVIAASLILQAALGPAMNSMVEALKAAGVAKEGQGGVASLALGTALGALAGLLAVATGEGHSPIWIGVGALAGLIGLGAGGVRSHLTYKGMTISGTNKPESKASAVGDPAVDAGTATDTGAAAPAPEVQELQELALGRAPELVANGR